MMWHYCADARDPSPSLFPSWTIVFSYILAVSKCSRSSSMSHVIPAAPPRLFSSSDLSFSSSSSSLSASSSSSSSSAPRSSLITSTMSTRLCSTRLRQRTISVTVMPPRKPFSNPGSVSLDSMSCPHSKLEKQWSSLPRRLKVAFGEAGKDLTYCVKSLASLSKKGICSDAENGQCP